MDLKLGKLRGFWGQSLFLGGERQSHLHLAV